MALSDELLGFTSPILDRAVKTGGWGRTIKTHDPSVVSDAIFKKAQLDLGIASLQADMGAEQFKMRSGVAMDLMHQNIQNEQMLIEERKNHLSFFEALANDIAGVAEGAVTGFMVGGPVGAVVGGAAGGALTVGSQASSGRRGAQNTLGALGTIASAATTIKGFSDQQKQKDSWTSILQGAGDIVGRMNSGSASDRQAAGQEWAQLLANATQGQIDAGVNPQRAFEATQSFSDAMLSGQEDGLGGMQSFADFLGADTPGRDDFKQFWEDHATAQDGGYHLLDPGQTGLMDAVGYGKGKANRFRPSTPETGDVNDPTTSPLPMEQPKITSKPSPVNPGMTIERLDANGNPTGEIIQPDKGRSIQQPAPSQSAGVQGRGTSPAFPVPQYNRPGLQIEPVNPAAAEQALAKQGGETVKVLAEQEKAKAREETIKKMEGLKRDEGFWDRGSRGMPWETDTARNNRVIDEAIQAEKEGKQKLADAPSKVELEQQLTDIRNQEMTGTRAAENPGVKESRAQAVDQLIALKDRTYDMPEKDKAQRGEKKGLQRAIDATENLHSIMEDMPDSLALKASHFLQQNGIGISSPHFKAEFLDAIGKEAGQKGQESSFTPQERDIIIKYQKNVRDLAYADALIDSGDRAPREDAIQHSMEDMPSIMDDYRERSEKLKNLAAGYVQDIQERTHGLVPGGMNKEDVKDSLEIQLRKSQLEGSRLENENKRHAMAQRESEAPMKNLQHWIRTQEAMRKLMTPRRRRRR